MPLPSPDFAAHAQPLGREQRALEPAAAPLVLAATIDGPLDAARLRLALTRVAARHPATGLVFGRVQGLRGLRQQFAGVAPVWSTEPIANGTTATTDAIDATAGAPFPALCAALQPLGPRQHRLTLTAHPLALDGSSLVALCRELARTYADAPAAGDDAPLSYADYLDWTTGLALEHSEAGRDYWQGVRDRTAALDTPRLPWRRNGEATAQPLVTEAIAFDDAEVAALRDWAGALAQPLPLALQAAWWLLLARLDPAGAFCGGWQHDCRDDFDALAGALGRYESVLPVVIQPNGAAPFADWLGQFAAQCGDHLDWREHCPPDAAAGAAGRIGFAMAPALPVRFRHGELQWEFDTPGAGVATLLPGFELAMQVRTGEDRMPRQLVLHHAASHYRADAMACLLDQYRTLLRTLRAQPGTAIDALPLATAADTARAKAMHLPALDVGAQLLPQRLAHWGRERPYQPALSAAGLQLNYRELNRRVDALAARLPALGLRPGAPVGLLLPRCGEGVIALLAVMRAGAAYLPLDPGWPAQRRARILADAGATLVVTDAAHMLGATDGLPPHVELAPLLAEIAAGPAEREDPRGFPELSAAQAAYVLFTSGSTGTPKGVAITHGQLLNYAVASGQALKLDGCQRFALTSTVAADLGNTTLFGALWHGACLCVGDEADMAGAASFASFLARERVDCLKIVPSHLDALLDGGTGPLPLPSDAVIVLGGEAASPALLARLRQRAPQVRVCNHYGPTETTVGILVHDAGRAATLGDAPLPLTQVLANGEAQVRNAAGHLAATGETGELCLGGAQLCGGYLGRSSDRSAGADDPFVPHPDRPGERLYRSGDLARYLPQGGIELIGRADGQLKVRGFRVECGEIEHVLAALPGVRHAVVLPVAADGGAIRLAAWLVPEDAAAVRLSSTHRRAVRDALADRLPEPMIPTLWFAAASLPRLPNGKIDRRALADAAASAQQTDRPPAREPADNLEALLLDQLRELLDAPRLSVQDDLFEAGGHSLLIIKLVARIRKLLKVEIAPAVVFDAPSAAALAAALRAASPDPAGLATLATLQRQLAAMSPEARAALRASAGATA